MDRRGGMDKAPAAMRSRFARGMDESFRIFASIATAIVLEAMPFLALGSMLSALVEVFVSPERVSRFTPRGLIPRVALGVGAGLVLPTCECGVVPVARRLLKKGVPGETAVAYMLAAPIVNPVVLASTFVAFRGSWSMVGARAAVAVIVAGTVALLARRLVGSVLLRPGRGTDEHGRGCAVEGSRFVRVWKHAASDFLDMGKYLLLGAFAAAALKTVIPLDVLQHLEGDLPLAIGGMMLLAILLSVCSEADAFVAASFVTFPAAAKLAFVTIGPMVDIKLIALYVATFRGRLVWLLVLVPLALVFALCWALGGWL